MFLLDFRCLMQMFQQLLSFHLLLQTSQRVNDGFFNQRMKLFLILNQIFFISFFLTVKYKLSKDKVSSPASPLVSIGNTFCSSSETFRSCLEDFLCSCCRTVLVLLDLWLIMQLSSAEVRT
ncbi:hypothetical protein XENOCAPTIV_026722 [Xenoophorus captivus]|uniref:Uncharacterized protein n=1 Tax=Xenoophorus captivus TaxID=1517983 RepID=A0ABV0QTL2_9TELE